MLRRSESIDVHSPDLCDLAGQLWREVLQVDGRFAVICNPHEVPVDENSKVVVLWLAARATVADECCRHELRGSSRKAIQ